MGQLSQIRFYHRLVSIYRSASSYEHHQYTYLFHSVKLFAQCRSAPGRCEMALPPNKAEPGCTVQSLSFCFWQDQAKSHLQARLTGRVGWWLVVQHSCDGSLIRQDKTCWLSIIPPAGKMQGFMKISDGGIPAVVISMVSASIPASIPRLMSIRMHVQ